MVRGGVARGGRRGRRVVEATEHENVKCRERKAEKIYAFSS